MKLFSVILPDSLKHRRFGRLISCCRTLIFLLWHYLDNYGLLKCKSSQINNLACISLWKCSKVTIFKLKSRYPQKIQELEGQSYPLPPNLSISEDKYYPLPPPRAPATRLGARQKIVSENTIPENAWDFQKQAHYMHFNIQLEQNYWYKS